LNSLSSAKHANISCIDTGSPDPVFIIAILAAVLCAAALLLAQRAIAAKRRGGYMLKKVHIGEVEEVSDSSTAVQ